MHGPKFEKFGLVQKMAAQEEDMDKINAQALRALTAQEVFTFKLAACDDQVDRDHERFSVSALEELAQLFVGRPVLADHVWSAEKQVARIYDAAVEEAEGVHRLILRCYMPRTERTAETITALESGLIRECSVGCAVGKAVCSVCRTDKAHTRCGHVPGREYGGRACCVELSQVKDAYECSLVAVPAQREAGVVKTYGGEDSEAPQAPVPAAGMEEDPEVQKALALLELAQYE